MNPRKAPCLRVAVPYKTYRTVRALADWRWQAKAGQVNVVHVSSFTRNRKFLNTKAEYGNASRVINVAHSLFMFFLGLFPVPPL